MDQNLLLSLSREYLKSYYSINSFVGCTINCAYCFLAPIKIVPMQPVQTINETALIDAMIQDPLFVRNKTVLSLNNRTDPFISPHVKESTLKLLEILDSKCLHNIVTITTKGALTKNDVERLISLKYINIVMIVTFNGLPLTIQPIDRSVQIKTMKNIADSGKIRLVHQFRPIIPGYNDKESIVREIITCAKQYCDCSVYQGIRINQKIANRLADRGYQYNGSFNIHKQKSCRTDEIFRIIQDEDPNYRIFDHTSCALSYLFHLPDYNLHYLKRECWQDCPQYLTCHGSCPQVPKEFKNELEKIGVISSVQINGNTLTVNGELTDEQKSFIKHNFHINVSASMRKMTFSESIMEG